MMVQAGHGIASSQPQVQAIPAMAIQRVARDAEFRRLGGAMAAGGAVLSVLPALGPLCPLRRITGVPCPFCGMTTATLAFARGDLGAAVAANPLALVLLLVIAIAFIPPLWRNLAAIRPPESVGRAAPKVALFMLIPMQLLQLHRFDLI